MGEGELNVQGLSLVSWCKPHRLQMPSRVQTSDGALLPLPPAASHTKST